MMREQRGRGMSKSRTLLAAAGAAVAVLVVLTACGSSSGGTSPSAPGPNSSSTAGSSPLTSASSSSGPAVVESNPPGDIPDNQAFVRYTGSGFTVTIPEGWARSKSGTSAVFSDKYNNITITPVRAAHAPTAASARTGDLPKIKAASKGFVPGTVSTVQRKAGTAILITYRAQSAVNPVTGKVAIEAVERYTFWRAGKSVTLTLAAPVGSDNVDPWRKVTDSFAWTT